MSETADEQATDSEAQIGGAQLIEAVATQAAPAEEVAEGAEAPAAWTDRPAADPDPATAHEGAGPDEAVVDGAATPGDDVTDTAALGAAVSEASDGADGAAATGTVGEANPFLAGADETTGAVTDERNRAEAPEGAVAVEDEPDDETSTASRQARTRKAPSRAQLEKEGEIAADFLETLLDICDLDGDLDVDIDGDRAAISIVDSEDGRVPRRLVGANGKVLDALQELTRLAVYSSTGDRSRLVLDIAGHRSDRRSELAEIARVAIESVKGTGQQQPLEPMSPFERKIIHDEVLAAGLHSESDGKEPHRFVVVHPV